MRDKSWIGKGQNKEEYCEKFKEVFSNCTVRCIVCTTLAGCGKKKTTEQKVENIDYQKAVT